MTENIKNLYDSVAQDYDMPDFETFQLDMQDDEKRKRFHTTLVEDGFEVPEFDQFTNDIVKKKEVSQPTGQPSSASSQLQFQLGLVDDISGLPKEELERMYNERKTLRDQYEKEANRFKAEGEKGQDRLAGVADQFNLVNQDMNYIADVLKKNYGTDVNPQVNPFEDEKTKASRSWRSILKQSVKDRLKDNPDADRIANETVDYASQLQKLDVDVNTGNKIKADFNSAMDRVKTIKGIVDENVYDNELKDKAYKDLAIDARAVVYEGLKDQNVVNKWTQNGYGNPFIGIGLSTLEMLDPQRAKNLQERIDNPAAREEDKRLYKRELETIGINTVMFEGNRNLIRLSSKPGSENSVNSLKGWVKYAEDQRKSQGNRYGDITSADIDRMLFDVTEGAEKSSGAKALYNVSLGVTEGVERTVGAMWDYLTKTREERLAADMERDHTKYLTDDVINYADAGSTFTEQEFIPMVTDKNIKSQLDKIMSSDLSREEKYKQAYPLVKNAYENGGIDFVYNPNKGNINVTSKAIVHALSTSGARSLGNMVVTAPLGGGIYTGVLAGLDAAAMKYDEQFRSGDNDPLGRAIRSGVTVGALAGIMDEAAALANAVKGVRPSIAATRPTVGGIVTGAGKQIAKEEVEEVATEILDGDVKNIKEVLLATAFTTAPVAGATSIMSNRRQSELYRQLWFEAGSNKQATAEGLKKMLDAGEINQTQFEQSTKRLDRAAELVKAMPRTDKNGNPLNDQQKAKYLDNLMIQYDAGNAPETLPSSIRNEMKQQAEAADADNAKILEGAAPELSKTESVNEDGQLVDKKETIKQKFDFIQDEDFVEESFTPEEDQAFRDSLPESGFQSEEELQNFLETGEYAMLTGQNPDAVPVSKKANSELNNRAQQWLADRGLKAIPIFGKYGNSERSFLVPGMTKQHAIEFANEFQQDSVAHSEGLVYKDGSFNPRTEGVSLEQRFDQGGDFFSSVNVGGNKVDFSINYDFDTKVPASDIDAVLDEAIHLIEKAYAKSGIKVVVDDNATGEGQERVSEGIFRSSTGQIIINRNQLKSAAKAARAIWHEASHPVMNIIRNTNRPLYDKMVAGLREAAKQNSYIDRSFGWARNTYKDKSDDVITDEAIVETLGKIADGTLDLNTLDAGLKQTIIDFVNSILEFLRTDFRVNDTDIQQFKNAAQQIVDTLRDGRDIAEVVGEENVGSFENDTVQQRANDVFEGVLERLGISYGDVNEKTGKKKVTNFDVASALNKYYKKAFKPLRIDDFGKKAMDIVSDYGTDEVIYAMSKFGKDSGRGWYTEDYSAALDTLQELDPDILSNPEVKEIATVVIAIASNSTDVATNLTRVIYAVDQYKKTGKIPTDVGTGKAIEAIASGVDRYNRLLDQFDGDVNALKEFLQTVRPVSESKKALIEKIGVSSYAKALEKDLATNPEWNEDEVLPTSVIIFGPKIGAFYSNLSGLGGTPTIDRWCIRTMYRYRGDMRGKVSASDLEGFIKDNGLEGQSNANVIALAESHGKIFNAILTGKGEYKGMSKAERNAALKPYRKGAQISDKLSGVVNDIKDGMTDKVSNAAKYARDFRSFTKKSFEEIQRKVEERTGERLDISDIQAILWIYEKNLFGAMGVKQREDATYSAAANTLVSKVRSGAISLENLKAGILTSGDAGIIEDGAMGDMINISVESYKEGVDTQPERANRLLVDQESRGNRSEDDLRADGTGKQRNRALTKTYGNLSPEASAKLSEDAKVYFQKTNKQTKKAVEDFIKGMSSVDVADYVLSNPDIPDSSLVWMAATVAENLNAEIDAAKSAGNNDRVDFLTTKQANIFEEFSRKATDLGQAVQAFIAFSGNPRAVDFSLKKILNMLKEKGKEDVSQEEVDTIKEKLAAIGEVKDGLPKDKAIVNLNHYLAGITPISMMDVLQGIWYAKILSGISTQSTNAFSNIFTTMFSVPLAATYESLKNQSLMPFFYAGKGMASGLAKGVINAGDIIRSGVMPKDADKYFNENILETFSWGRTKVGQLGGGVVGKILDSPLLIEISPRALRYVGRSLAASDAIFSTISQEAMANMYAFELAKAEGKKDPTVNTFKRVQSILGNTNMEVGRAKVEAKNEGFKPGTTEYKRRVFELVKGNRTVDMNQKAEEFGKKVTLTNKPEGFTKPFYDMVTKLISEVPAVKMWVPFTGVVANLSEQMIDYSPLGLYRAISGVKNPFSPRGQDNKLTDEQRGMIAMRVAAGMTALALLATHVGDDEDDWFEVTGALDGNSQKKYELMKGGERPYTITFKDGTKWSYQNSPLRGVLGAVGTLRDAHRFGETPETSMDKITVAATGFWASLFESSVMSGLAEFIEIFTPERRKVDTDKWGDAAAKWAADKFKSVALSNFTQQVLKSIDEYQGDPMRNAKGFEVLYKDIPGLNDGINPIIDVFGDPVTPKMSEKVSQIYKADTDKLIEFLSKNKIFVGVAGKRNIYDENKEVDVPMNDQQLYNYRKRAGQLTRLALLESLSDLMEMDQEEMKKEVGRIVAGAREEAYTELFID